MNIKFGDNNFYTRYLKRFLNHELGRSTTVLGDFDKDDLESLITYLNLPNVKTMFEVNTQLTKMYPELKTMFVPHLQNDVITWVGKEMSQEVSQWLTNNKTAIKEFCTECGWEVAYVTEYMDVHYDINQDGRVDAKDRKILYNITYDLEVYDQATLERADLNLDGVVDQTELQLFDEYCENNKMYITIKKCGRHNYFPNQDMLVFVNQFQKIFMQGYAIKDGIGIDGVPHKDAQKTHKIALYKCKPGEKVTIAHNMNKAVNMIIGCSPAVLKQNIKSFMLDNIVEINLKPGEGYKYTCTSVDERTGADAQWLCIQVPSDFSNLEGGTEKEVALMTGDINFDGKIDWLDYHLLARYTASGPGAEDLHWEPTRKQLCVMNVDTENEEPGTINNKDTIRLYKYVVDHPTFDGIGLGVSWYRYDSDEYPDVDNVNNLLIMEGHYSDDTNIPFDEFVEDDWVIHEKFFNYLFGMAITKYSKSEDITYLQKLLREFYPEYMYDEDFFYPGRYDDNMKELIKKYQKLRVKYTLGDLNKDNALTQADLDLLRTYLDDLDKLALIKQFVNYEKEHPTPEELEELDLNGDGLISYADQKLFEMYLEDTYPTSFIIRADVNQDGEYNEADYQMLKDNIDGTLSNLKHYETPFMLGWLDVQTEQMLESDVNMSMQISEVSK